MLKPVENIIADIIQHELNLPDNWGVTEDGNEIPCVYVGDSNIKLYNTPHLQISVRVLSENVYSNNNEVTYDTLGNFIEVQSTSGQVLIQVDVYSANDEARTVKDKVIAALHSIYAQQQQDIYEFKISTIPTLKNLTGVDGGSIVKHYAISFNALIWHEETKIIDYYDKFPFEIYTEAGKI